jgi:hypothetical protein
MLNIKHEKSERMSINLNINNFFFKKIHIKKNISSIRTLG